MKPSTPSKDRANLLAILDSVERIDLYTKGTENPAAFFEAKQAFDATLMNFITIGEMVDRLSKELKDGHPEIDWQDIKGLRNIVVHDYLGVDAEEVWQIIKTELPLLKANISRMLQQLD
jgi:uncharacterized protein with HEPN domain